MNVQGWMASEKTKPLEVIGNPGNSYGQYLVKTYRDDRLHFIGAIYDADTVNALRHFSTIYFHGHSVGGTNPSLLEAMATGCTIAAHDNVFNRSILNEDGWYFYDIKSVRDILGRGPDPALVAAWKEKNLEKVKMLYNWEKIIDAYESVFTSAPNLSI
jgi:glycosyltransferase involved in cell wall biosynthesis